MNALRGAGQIVVALGLLLVGCGDGDQPDTPGHRIAFLSNLDSQRSLDIYVLDMRDPGEPVRVTREGADLPLITEFAWDPDGDQIAYAYEKQPGALGSLLLADVEGGEQTTLLGQSPGTVYRELAWSPDGGEIALVAYPGESAGPVGDARLMLVPVDGSEPTVFDERPACDDFAFADVGVFHWSPDGEQVLYVSDPDAQDCNVQPQVWIYEVDSKERQPLIELGPGEAALMPRWSPDGKGIAYIHADWDTGGELRIVSSDGEESRILAAGSIVTFAWAPGGQQIGYATVTVDEESGRPKGTSLAVVDAGSGAPLMEIAEPLAGVPITRLLEWSPDGAHLSMQLVALDDGGVSLSDTSWVILSAASGDLLTSLDATWAFDWSNDGRLIVFVSNPVPVNPDRTDEGILVVSDPDGNNRRQLITGQADGVHHEAVTWEP